MDVDQKMEQVDLTGKAIKHMDLALNRNTIHLYMEKKPLTEG